MSLRLATIALAVAVSVSAALGQHAPVADLAVEVRGESRVRANYFFPTNIVVTNHGPATVPDAVVTLIASPVLSRGIVIGLPPDRCSEIQTDTVRCALNELKSGESVRLETWFGSGPLPEVILVRAELSSSVTDPDPSNNVDSLSIDVSVDPDLTLSFYTYHPVRVDPGGEVKQFVGLSNYSVAAAREVIVVIDLPEGSELLSLATSGRTCQGPPENVTCLPSQVRWDCASIGTQITCRTAEIPVRTGEGFELASRIAAIHPGGKTTASARVSSAGEFSEANNFATTEVFVYRHYDVTTTEDAGPGSLRTLIEEANRDCHSELPCKIDFQLPGPPSEDGTFIIRPLSPLPEVTATDVMIDATTQTSRVGDSNPHGPEVVLSGAHLSAGNGLSFRSACEMGVRGLVINGFPENGLVVSRDGGCEIYRYSRIVEQNYIGTDATGTRAVPNRLRGIVLDSGTRICNFAAIESNLVSGNGRSGIFLYQACAVTVENNLIGTTASGDAPLPNGASGIYFALPSYYGADIYDNVIAFNAEFGISTNSRFGYIGFRHNRIHSNGLLGVDLGLDGVNPADAQYVQLLSARYDAARGKTVVEGILDTPPALYALGRFVLEFFATSAPDPSEFGEGEAPLGEIVSTFSYPVREFNFEYDGDLRGKFITATAANYEIGFKPGPTSAPDRPWQGYPYRTSEFSRAIRVTP